MKTWLALFLLLPVLTLAEPPAAPPIAPAADRLTPAADRLTPVAVDQYVPVTLTTDITRLNPRQRQMIKILIAAADRMNDAFWYESYGDRDTLLQSIDDPATRRFAEINYGPWDRLSDNRPFIAGVGAKPAGANFYPVDMSKDEFESASLPGKAAPYTFVRRDADGHLITIPYHQQLAEIHDDVAAKLRDASDLADVPSLRRYLRLRADALQSDDYQLSDMAWLDMKRNVVEIVIGPIENYEDKLFGYKTAHEAYVLVKDVDWSRRLERYAEFLPMLQRSLPVPDAYKSEQPGTDTELNAYDVVYYAGDCNAGSKTIAINLPNDEAVQLQKGTRRLQLKNAMRAKFDNILLPIADELVDPDQRHHVTFDAFFSNTMFHEVAHGLGIKQTINNRGLVRTSLRQHAAAIEEGKADILGLHMIRQLHASGEITSDLMDHYVTFMAGIFRSVRFGAASAHGKANMIRFNFFRRAGAFEQTPTGHYRVNPDRFAAATEALSRKLLTLQGDGDYNAANDLIQTDGIITPDLQSDLDRLTQAGIPIDVVFQQGVEVLGL